jgi:hypothetical protein
MYFTPKNVWYGGFYELALELGEPSDERLFEALDALWQHPSVEGCYLENDVEPNEQKRVSPSPQLLNRMHIYGLARLPDGKQVACGSCIIREDDGSDWLDFYLPTGAVGEVYDIGGYPFDKAGFAHRDWQIPVDEWLKDIGKHIFSIVPFNLGLIGFEVSGEAYAADILKTGIPAERHIGYLLSENKLLKWYAPNTFVPS